MRERERERVCPRVHYNSPATCVTGVHYDPLATCVTGVHYDSLATCVTGVHYNSLATCVTGVHYVLLDLRICSVCLVLHYEKILIESNNLIITNSDMTMCYKL